MRVTSTSGTLDSAPWRAAGRPKAPGAKEWKKGCYLKNSKLLIKVPRVIITLTITAVVYRAFWLSRLSAQGHRHVALLFLWEQFAVEDPAEVQAGLNWWAREAEDKFVSARLQSLPQNCCTSTSRTSENQKSPIFESSFPSCLRRFGWSQFQQTAFGSQPAPGHSPCPCAGWTPRLWHSSSAKETTPKVTTMVTTVGSRDWGAASCRCIEVVEGLLNPEAGQTFGASH
jgi:hypothetical protein